MVRVEIFLPTRPETHSLLLDLIYYINATFEGCTYSQTDPHVFTGRFRSHPPEGTVIIMIDIDELKYPNYLQEIRFIQEFIEHEAGFDEKEAWIDYFRVAHMEKKKDQH